MPPIVVEGLLASKRGKVKKPEQEYEIFSTKERNLQAKERAQLAELLTQPNKLKRNKCSPGSTSTRWQPEHFYILNILGIQGKKPTNKAPVIQVRRFWAQKLFILTECKASYGESSTLSLFSSDC